MEGIVFNTSPARQRNPSYFIYAVIALLVSVPFTYWALQPSLTTLEENLFVLINSLPNWLYFFMFTVMQLGALGAVIGITILLALWRKFDIARDVFISGTVGWLVAKAIKFLVGRGRPDSILELFEVRNVASGLGYPSGHATIAFAIAFAIAPYATTLQRRIMYVLAAIVAISRVYVGVHLPFDVIGGALFGFTIAFLVHGIFGVKKFSYTKAQVKNILSKIGMPAKKIESPNVDARASIIFIAHTDRQPVLIKVYGPAHQNADWLFKIHRKLLFKRAEHDTPYLTSKQQVEHEMFIALFAKSKGILVPDVYQVATSDDGVIYSTQQHIDGKSIDKLESKDLNADVLHQAWDILKKLRENRIAHRDLRTSNLLLSKEGELYLIDFDDSEAAAGRYYLNLDLAELLVSLSIKMPTKEVVDTAAEELGVDVLKQALPLLHPQNFSSATKRYLKKHKGHLEKLISEVEAQTGEKMPTPKRFRKGTVNFLLSLSAIGLGFYFLTPRVNELLDAIDVLMNINLWYIPILVALSFATYVAAAVTFRGAIPDKKPLKDIVFLQFAGSFINRITPTSIGSLGLNTVYLYKQRYSKAQAALFALLPLVAGFITSALIVLIGLQFVDLTLNNLQIPAKNIAIFIGALLVAIGLVATFVPKFKQYIKDQLTKIVSGLKTIKKPSHAMQLVMGALANTLFFASTLYVSAIAVGEGFVFMNILIVMLAGTAIGSASPTPGGLGVEEAALVTGLGLIGMNLGAAVAAVLLYRLATYWLPIPFGVLAFRNLRKRELV